MGKLNTPFTNAHWRKIAVVGYPKVEDFGPYPCVLVAMECRGQPDFGFRVEQAELRFFGGDKTRPYWCSPFKNQGHAPIENDSWHVTQWTPMVGSPDPSTISVTKEKRQ